MEKQTDQLINQHIKRWAQYLLIEQICNPANNQSKAYSNNFNQNSLNNHKNHSFRIGQFLSPFYMAQLSQKEKQSNPQSIIRQCISNSHNTQNLYLLLTSVLQLPKLRYQQSFKLFQQQSQPNSITQHPNESSKPLNPTKFNLQASSDKSAAQKLYDVDMNKTILNVKTADPKSETKFKFENSTNHRIIDLQEVSNEQNEIQANISSRSYHQVHVIKQNGDVQSKSFHSNFVKTSKKYEQGPKQQSGSGNRRIPYKQPQIKAKEQRNMIQNYFQSAKNRVFQNCGINCCQGIFSNQNSHKIPPSQNLHHLNLKYGQQSTQKPFKKK